MAALGALGRSVDRRQFGGGRAAVGQSVFVRWRLVVLSLGQAQGGGMQCPLGVGLFIGISRGVVLPVHLFGGSVFYDSHGLFSRLGDKTLQGGGGRGVAASAGAPGGHLCSCAHGLGALSAARTVPKVALPAGAGFGVRPLLCLDGSDDRQRDGGVRCPETLVGQFRVECLQAAEVYRGVSESYLVAWLPRLDAGSVPVHGIRIQFNCCVAVGRGVVCGGARVWVVAGGAFLVHLLRPLYDDGIPDVRGDGLADFGNTKSALGGVGSVGGVAGGFVGSIFELVLGGVIERSFKFQVFSFKFLNR